MTRYSVETMTLLHGSPLSGKGAVARALEELGCTVVSTSGLIDRYASEEVKREIRNGNLVVDDVMLGLLESCMHYSEHMVIDSLRSPKQLRWARNWMPNARIHSLHLIVSEETVRERAKAAPLTERGTRDDDAPHTVEFRLSKAREYLPATLEAARLIGEVYPVVGEQPPARVAGDVVRLWREKICSSGSVIYR